MEQNREEKATYNTYLAVGNTKEATAISQTTLNDYKIRVKNVIITIPETKFWAMNEIIDYIQHYKNFKYILICEHNGPEKVHRHLYAQYENTTTLSSLKLYNCHIEKSFGSAQSCIKYLKAEDDKHIKLGVKSTLIYENGQMSERGGNRIGDIKKMSDDEINNLPTCMYNVVQKIRPQPKIKLNEWHKKVKVYYINGTVSGIGKTLSIYRILMLNHRDEEGITEIKHIGEFWHGVSGEEVGGVAVYDDFRDWHMSHNEFINFIDYHIHNLNFKGGSSKNKFDFIIITSIQPLNEIYKNIPEDNKQWIRRVKNIDLDKININMAQNDANDNFHQNQNQYIDIQNLYQAYKQIQI